MGLETGTSRAHGTKRSANDALEGEQRLSKRFNLLNLEQNGKLFIPVDSRAQPTTAPAMHAPANNSQRGLIDDRMHLDNTKSQVYIYNLDEELSSDNEVADEDRVVFLPEIEKQLAKIPQHILRGDTESPRRIANELVLYSVPRSITVSEDKDSVRKAIIESRARARQEQQQQQRRRQQQQDKAAEAEPASHDAMLHDGTIIEDRVAHNEAYDPDAMDTG